MYFEQKSIGSVPLTAGFEDPVHDGQMVFAKVMEAMSRPGKIMPVSAMIDVPEPLNTTAGAVLLTLADYDSTLWLAEEFTSTPKVRSWISFHTGAPVIQDRGASEFALLDGFDGSYALGQFQQGIAEYPDRSTTLIIQVNSLENRADWRMTGPGIEEANYLSVETVSRGFVVQWAQNRSRFPLGVDVILCAPGAIACLPRSVNIEEV